LCHHAATVEKLAATLNECTSTFFHPSSTDFIEGTEHVFPFVMRRDVLVNIAPGVNLGCRFLLQVCTNGSPKVNEPLLLMFHGNAETCGTYLAKEVGSLLVTVVFLPSSATSVVMDFQPILRLHLRQSAPTVNP